MGRSQFSVSAAMQNGLPLELNEWDTLVCYVKRGNSKKKELESGSWMQNPLFKQLLIIH